MKKAVIIFLTVFFILGSLIPCYASTLEAEKSADLLYELGLFSGTGKDADGKPVYQLDRAPTRYEAATMLVGLLGKADIAREGTWTTPFKDVAVWARPYVGYAYTMGYTSGTGAQTFGGTKKVTAQQYLTFIYRALGYSNEEVPYDSVLSRAITDGLITQEMTSDFTRGDVVVVSYKALALKVNGSGQTLAQSLGITQALPENRTLTADFQDTVWTQITSLAPTVYFEFSKGKYRETYAQYVDPKYADMLLDRAYYWTGNYVVFGDTVYITTTTYYYNRWAPFDEFSKPSKQHADREFTLQIKDGLLEGWSSSWDDMEYECKPADPKILNHVRDFFAENGYH